MSPGQEAARDGLQKRLGYTFQDGALLERALRHRSYVHQFRSETDEAQDMEDNQRLEFLGDAVLGLCVGTLLYDTFPDFKEGEMSKMRAGLVNEARLAKLARQIDLPSSLLLGRGEDATGGRDKDSILADAVEAVLAAIYLDGGFEASMEVVENLWGELISLGPGIELLGDYKTRLQELTQRVYGEVPTYLLTGTEGPDHDRTFEVSLVVGGRPLASGKGRSKKAAEKAAARSALEKLGRSVARPS
ncbi:MAG: ribonuclease III [Proteobacteria bacterium]|nr:ribonuclease III [Pseudomonadota bacterium]